MKAIKNFKIQIDNKIINLKKDDDLTFIKNKKIIEILIDKNVLKKVDNIKKNEEEVEETKIKEKKPKQK